MANASIQQPMVGDAPGAQIIVGQPIEAHSLARLQRCSSTRMNPGPEPLSRQAMLNECAHARALMVFMTERIDEDFLAECPHLEIIAGALKGFDNIDVDACSRRNILVTIVPDLLTDPTAELAIALMINVARHVGPADSHVRTGHFAGWRPTYFGRSIQGATIGVVGAGRVGQTIMKMLAGFNCTRLYHDVQPLPAETETELNASFTSLTELQAQSDFVVLALPLTEATLGLVDAPFIARMKADSLLINPARGSLVVESAVADALDSGHLAGYGADVYECEDWARSDRPAAIEQRLLQADNTMLTPHIGSAVTSVRRAIVESATDSIVTTLAGSIPSTAINAEAVARTGRRAEGATDKTRK